MTLCSRHGENKRVSEIDGVKYSYKTGNSDVILPLAFDYFLCHKYYRQSGSDGTRHIGSTFQDYWGVES